MKKFLFIYNASDDADSGEAWISWFTAIKQNLIVMGNPFNGGKIVTNYVLTISPEGFEVAPPKASKPVNNICFMSQ